VLKDVCLISIVFKKLLRIKSTSEQGSPIRYLKNVLETGNVDSSFSKLSNILSVLMQQYQEYSLTTIKPFKLYVKEKHLERVPQV
jgi:hypothetical protein